MTIVATDYDAGDNGTVVYEIDAYGNPPAAPNGEYLFKINSNGLIKTNIGNSLDREKIAVYYLPIVAKDKGVEQRRSTATATIKIIDINDQKPQFIDVGYLLISKTDIWPCFKLLNPTYIIQMGKYVINIKDEKVYVCVKSER